MSYPFDNDDDNSCSYGMNADQIWERMNYAVNGEDDSDDYSLDFGDLEDEEPEDDD
jgi:hypothetical protein